VAASPATTGEEQDVAITALAATVFLQAYGLPILFICEVLSFDPSLPVLKTYKYPGKDYKNHCDTFCNWIFTQ